MKELKLVRKEYVDGEIWYHIKDGTGSCLRSNRNYNILKAEYDAMKVKIADFPIEVVLETIKYV